MRSHPDATGGDGQPPVAPDASSTTDPRLDAMMVQIDLAIDPVVDGAAMSPAVGIAVAGGPMFPGVDEQVPEPDLPVGPLPDRPVGARNPPNLGVDSETVRGGLAQAGPVAVAGLIVNVASALVVVVVARLLTARSYGTIAQLLGLFFILSMPGSAVLVGVVRRVAIWQRLGRTDQVARWARRVHRMIAVALVVETILVWLTRGWIAEQLGLPGSQGVVLILVAGGVWILLSVDRGLLQAHRDYWSLAKNLLMEGGVRTAAVLALVALGMGVSGYAIGIFVSEVAATVQARWLASRAWAARPVAALIGRPDAVAPDTAPSEERTGRRTGGGRTVPADPVRRDLVADVITAFVGLALLGLLQNVDVLVLGRLNHTGTGAYAAVSVASKALVFGALALGSYLLPEATIRWNEGGHAVRQLGVTLVFLAVPAVVLLAIGVTVPRQFLTLIFSGRLNGAASAFGTLAGAMIFLCMTVLLTNYLIGVGRRWIVCLLAAGAGVAVVLIWRAHGDPLSTARADLLVQAVLAIAMGVAFVVVHYRQHGDRWHQQWLQSRARWRPGEDSRPGAVDPR